MFEVLTMLRRFMSAQSSRRCALFLAILMAFIGPIQMAGHLLPDEATQSELSDQKIVHRSLTGSETFIQLPGDNIANTDFTIDVPSDAPITDMQMSLTPSVAQNHYGFVWKSANDWSNSDATNNGTVVEQEALTGSTAGTLWDFNSGLQGWTVSSSTYVGRYTNNCGINGTSGGSIKTQANYNQAHHATSPVVNLAGAPSMPLHAWVKQGNSGCGEEPDSGEDLQIQYKTAAGQWTTLNTWLGSTSGGTAQQWSTNLPQAALHSTTQIRINQISGSGAGSCCDFWFVDDVHLASPPESFWISPSLGWSPAATQSLEEAAYAPLHLDADIPNGSFLNWSILDAAGNEILGASGSNDAMIPLNMLNHEVHSLFRVKLEFRGSENGIPTLYSIAGDGQHTMNLRAGFADQGFTTNCSNGGAVNPIGTGGLIGTPDCNLTTGWFTTTAPAESMSGNFELQAGQIQVRFDEDSNWTNLSTPAFSHQHNETIYRYQFRIVHDNVSQTAWEASTISWKIFSGSHPAEPAIDFNQDGLLEWGGSDNRVGSWGWQDRFENGQTRVAVSPGISGSATTSAWIPRDNIQSFSVGVMAETGILSGLYIRVGSQLIANYSYSGASSDYVSLNDSQLTTLRFAASNAASVGYLGANFVQVSFEVTGSGGMTMAGLSVPYPVSVIIDATQQSPLVLGINSARSELTVNNGEHNIPIPFISDTAGGLDVILDGVNYSSDVEVSSSYMEDPVQVLTPSQRWHTMHTSFVVSSSTAGLVRLDVVGFNNHATWLIPTGGGSPIGQGDSELVELHPDQWLNFSQDGSDIDVAVSFRIKQGWDDEYYMSASTRLVLSNGVVSIPATHTWGSPTGEAGDALENDMELKSVTFFTDLGELPSDEYYLPAGQHINISIDVGYEGLSGIDGFFDGEAVVKLYHGNTEIANTTTLDDDTWNFTDVVPFTNGVLDWKVEVIPLDGAGTTQDAVFERSFFADSVSPSVYWSSVAPYDHRTASTTQAIQIQITDQPLLPSNVEAMVWREWANDYDMNGQPSPDEYEPISSILLPNDLTALVGQYTLLLDDTGGSTGEKVAVYLTGNDAAGHPLEDNGTGEEGEHLLMYQLKADGPPSIPNNAFVWDGSRKNWLHPMIDYTFEVSMSEPNGGSDLSTVLVELASKQGSDTLPISWNFLEDNCTTTSIHLVIESCEMLGPNGKAGPYEEDITLRVNFNLMWTLPELGETPREPKLTVVDRAGNTDEQTFPELRWKFSAEMYVPEETIQLFIDQGTEVADGARIAPGSTFEVSGEVLFKETNTKPNFDCLVNVNLGGSTFPATAFDGIWSTVVQSPTASGQLALTWEVGCLTGQGSDGTDQSKTKWILIDGTGPEPVEVINPRPNAILATDVYEVRVAIDELGGLDTDSLQLIWWVEDEETGEQLRSGTEPMQLDGNDLAGTQLEIYGEVDLSDITDSMIERKLILFVRIGGRDLADNAILGLNGAPSGGVVAQWNLEWLRPEFSLDTAAISYTRLLLEVEQSTSVQILVNNVGSLDGTVDATVSVVRLNGSKETLQRPSVEVPAGGVGLISLDWSPTKEGIQWIEVELDNGDSAKGPTVDVRPAREQGFVENLFGDVDPVIGSVVALIFISIIITGLIYARKATLGKGARSEYDWDEYSSDVDYDDYDDGYTVESSAPQTGQDIQPSSSLNAASAALGIASAETAAEEETDWVMGSDGYWWYHDKEANEWWYKDENGEIVKFN